MLCMNLCKLHIDSAYPIVGRAGLLFPPQQPGGRFARSLADLAETLASDVPPSPDRADRVRRANTHNEGGGGGHEMVASTPIKSRWRKKSRRLLSCHSAAHVNAKHCLDVKRDVTRQPRSATQAPYNISRLTMLDAIMRARPCRLARRCSGSAAGSARRPASNGRTRPILPFASRPGGGRSISACG
jgi:hypothetical protein